MKAKRMTVFLAAAFLTLLLTSCSWGSRKAHMEDNASTGSGAYADSKESMAPDDAAEHFPAFEGMDLEGNRVKSDEIFGSNAATVINFWFTTCGPCVGELSELDKLNRELSEKGAALIGINAFTIGGDMDAISDAKDVLARQGASYRNVYFDADSEAGVFASGVYAFPTTYVVDRNGVIVGEPVIGALTGQKQMDTLQNLIDQAVGSDAGGDTGAVPGKESMYMDTTENVIYLAGGCFWGMEQLMQSIPGVTDARSGYANGTGESDANYAAVSAGNTGFRETVRVEYDPKQVSLDALLLAYFYVIDPTVQNRQGNDRGSQYQTGVYYTNDAARETVERIADIERGRSSQFFVEIGPLVNFYPAEEYHQDYLEKNPGGYCHIPREEMELFSHLRIDPGDYQKPAAEAIRDKLTAEQYRITQESGTERPFANEFWNQFEKGIYVDVVTGEPLFSSTDKFESGCGWPAFSKPIEIPAVVELPDDSHGMHRTEVRSRSGNSHLGHVFTGDSESPNGVRYCINSAALRFVPYAKMEEEGYGYLLEIFEP